jgi:hypothetical protein
MQDPGQAKAKIEIKAPVRAAPTAGEAQDTTQVVERAQRGQVLGLVAAAE